MKYFGFLNVMDWDLYWSQGTGTVLNSLYGSRIRRIVFTHKETFSLTVYEKIKFIDCNLYLKLSHKYCGAKSTIFASGL